MGFYDYLDEARVPMFSDEEQVNVRLSDREWDDVIHWLQQYAQREGGAKGQYNELWDVLEKIIPQIRGEN